MVGTGREGDKSVSELRFHTGIIQRQLLHIGGEILQFLGRICLKELIEFEHGVGLFVDLRPEHRHHLIFTADILFIQINIRMLLGIIGILILHQRAEHPAGLHIMPMDDLVGGDGVQTAVGIQDETTVLVTLLFEIAVQIIVLISGRPHHRLIDLRVRYEQPCGHILILIKVFQIGILDRFLGHSHKQRFCFLTALGRTVCLCLRRCFFYAPGLPGTLRHGRFGRFVLPGLRIRNLSALRPSDHLVMLRIPK